MNILFYKKASKIYTKEVIHHKKPNPEGYLRVLHDFPQDKYPYKIGFEDSMRGLYSLLQVKSIIPIFVNTSQYAYFTEIDSKSLENLLEKYNFKCAYCLTKLQNYDH
jgi:beta-phosphoglucomutase-like phosphatase (HAD superfamily)